ARGQLADTGLIGRRAPQGFYRLKRHSLIPSLLSDGKVRLPGERQSPTKRPSSRRPRAPPVCKPVDDLQSQPVGKGGAGKGHRGREAALDRYQRTACHTELGVSTSSQ